MTDKFAKIKILDGDAKDIVPGSRVWNMATNEVIGTTLPSDPTPTRRQPLLPEIKDWWDRRYLFNHVVNHLAVPPKGIEPEKWLNKKVAEYRILATNIVKSKRYEVLPAWFGYYTEILKTYYSDKKERLWLDNLGNLTSVFYDTILGVYGLVCAEKRKMLVGTGSRNHPLWIDWPKTANVQEGLDSMYNLPYLLRVMPDFSADQSQLNYDKLMFFQQDKPWISRASWPVARLNAFEEKLANLIGFESGVVDEDEYVQILAEAYLNQRYQLVENRPVLVRIEDNPLIREVIMVKKRDRIYSRIETFDNTTILHFFSLSEIEYDSTWDYLKSSYSKLPSDNLALTALIATIYRDLVIVSEEKVSKPRGFKSVEPRPKEEKTDKPTYYTTMWQYIPRVQYTKINGNDTTVATRQALTPTEEERQRRVRRYHMVCGFVRRFRDKPDFMASGDRQDLALADGIILRQGETYVRPHARGVSALDELGEIDISSIPHYLRRKTKPR